MVLAAHHLRGHIAWRAWCVMRVIRRPNSRYPEICDTDIPIVIKQKILGLYVAMNHAMAMHILQPDDNACNKKLSLWLWEPSTLILMVPKIAACHEVRNQEDVHIVGKRVKHVDQEPKELYAQ